MSALVRIPDSSRHYGTSLRGLSYSLFHPTLAIFFLRNELVIHMDLLRQSQEMIPATNSARRSELGAKSGEGFVAQSISLQADRHLGASYD
jgi:hypothetical protein